MYGLEGMPIGAQAHIQRPCPQSTCMTLASLKCPRLRMFLFQRRRLHGIQKELLRTLQWHQVRCVRRFHEVVPHVMHVRIA